MSGRRHVVPSEGAPLASEQDAVDLVGQAHGAEWVEIPVSRLAPEMFDLRTRSLGLFLQKLVNYGLRVAIVGPLPEAATGSRALRDLVTESNRSPADGRSTVWFVGSRAELDRRRLPPRDPAAVRAAAVRGGLVVAPPVRLEAVEEALGVELPAGYARFLVEVGAGIAGPDGPLVYTPEQSRAALGGADPRRPFPYDDARAAELHRALTVGGPDSPAVRALQLEGPPHGWLPLLDLGCNDVVGLVVTGPQAGWVWRTGELDAPDLLRVYTQRPQDDVPLDFDAWLDAWLAFGW